MIDPDPRPASAHDGPSSDERCEWEPLGAADGFAPGALRSVRARGHRLVVARRAGGEIHVLDDRCPHEGYPLAQGTLAGTALTCCWHNWKFDVRDGRCLLGGEAVRAFPSQVRDGRLEVDLSEPDPGELVPPLRASLEEALVEGDLGRALRDGARLLLAGHGPVRLLADVARHDARRAEYGTTHVLAVAADAARLLGRYPGPQAMVPIALAVDLCAESNRRLPVRPTPPPAGGADAAALREAVERERVEEAEALVRGAFADGVPRATIEGWVLAVLSDHFTDFGHQLIYLVKAQELSARLAADAGEEEAYACAAEVLPALVHGAVLGTREDTLPYMRPYRSFLERVEPELEDVHGRARDGAPFEPEALRDAVLDGRSEHALESLWSALRAGVGAPRVARALVAAAAHRLLRYDERLESDGTVAENFLWATHRFTFASAVRNAVERFPGPDALRLLFQAVAFVHTGRAMDAPPDARAPIRAEPADAEAVLDAIRAKDPRAAVARAAGCLGVGGREALRVSLEDFALSDPVVRPIAVAHVLKTTVAAFEEAEALGDGPDRDVPILAAARTWALPLVERRVRASVATALRWVVDGKVPRKLTQ